MIRILAVIFVASACVAPAGHSTGSTVKGSSAPARVSTAETLCRAALPDQPVVAWADSTVGELRAYHYGGPVARNPLKTEFPGLPASQRAAWCWVPRGTLTMSIWGVTSGSAALAISVTGPRGENLSRGHMQGPPRIP